MVATTRQGSSSKLQAPGKSNGKTSGPAGGSAAIKKGPKKDSRSKDLQSQVEQAEKVLTRGKEEGWSESTIQQTAEGVRVIQRHSDVTKLRDEGNNQQPDAEQTHVDRTENNTAGTGTVEKGSADVVRQSIETGRISPKSSLPPSSPSSTEVDSASTSRSTLSPNTTQDSESGLVGLEDRILPEQFSASKMPPLYDEKDPLEGRIRGPGHAVYHIYKKGNDKDPKYYMIHMRSSQLSDTDKDNLDTQAYSKNNAVGKGSIKSFAGVACKSGTLGLVPSNWKKSKNGAYVRPCHRIKVVWRTENGTATSWEKRSTIKKCWLNTGYPTVNDINDNTNMTLLENMEIDGRVVLKKDTEVDKLDRAILKEAIRCDKNYERAGNGNKETDMQRGRSLTPEFAVQPQDEMQQ
ncbi:hypothetical protein FALBO_4609 [Fusarium albosuccineum]|uniref:Uncharacterized protein n=1 Tax=Fusarium albosuccineum TaxID=1237068 RepID=A0A8H4LI22_9HYPO|nr:hypothetical protein FALBO_4609 [Fusarium albosuccineum]